MEKQEKNKPRRKRTIITPDQLHRLERAFRKDQWPSRVKKGRIARELGTSEKFVCVWFQNRRARVRRETGQSDDCKVIVDENDDGIQKSDIDENKPKHEIVNAAKHTPKIVPAEDGSKIAKTMQGETVTDGKTLEDRSKPRQQGKHIECSRNITVDLGPRPIFKVGQDGSYVLSIDDCNVRNVKPVIGANATKSSCSPSLENKTKLPQDKTCTAKDQGILATRKEPLTLSEARKKFSMKLKGSLEAELRCSESEQESPSDAEQMQHASKSRRQKGSTGKKKHGSETRWRRGLPGVSTRPYTTPLSNVIHKSHVNSAEASRDRQAIIHEDRTKRCCQQPTLFRAIMGMLAVAEGATSHTDPSFHSSVNDALYGININNDTMLVFDEVIGLDLIPMT